MNSCLKIEETVHALPVAQQGQNLIPLTPTTSEQGARVTMIHPITFGHFADVATLKKAWDLGNFLNDTQKQKNGLKITGGETFSPGLKGGRAYIGPAKAQDLAKVSDLRLSLGLSPIKRGKRSCLMCSKKFISEDLKNQKCCNICRQEK